MPSSEHFRGCPTARFMRKVSQQGDCLIWTGAVSQNGYGCFWFDDRLWPAHRAALAMFGRYSGPLHVDHLCRNRRCVNPEHLEPVTQKENNRRASLTRDYGGDGPCKYGHPATDRRRSGISVYCLSCRRNYERSVRRAKGVPRRVEREK